MKSISEIADVLDQSGEKHSNTKVMTLVVIVGELGLWGALKFTDRVLTATDAAFLISLVIAAYSIRALLAFVRAKTNGVNGNGDGAGAH